MKRQKRIAVINDVTGFGRCAAAVAQPIISAHKIQCCVLPTAILSAHTGFSNFFLHDFTPYMETYMKHWKEQSIEFDGISTGFLGSKEQIALVIHFFELFKKENSIVIVDPVMGDYGKLYSSYTDDMCEEMKKLLPYADILTPNLTEACRLLDMDYHNTQTNDAQLENIAKALSEKGPQKVVITGIQKNQTIINFLYEKGQGQKKIIVDKIGEDRSGTGDIFSSILSANIINGVDFYTSVKKAADFINKTIAFTVELDIPVFDGLCFEEFLTELK